MSIKFQNLQIQFIKDISNGFIKSLGDIKLFIENNHEYMDKPSEPRRLFRVGCKILEINLQSAKIYIKKNKDLVLFLWLQYGVVDIDKFLNYL